VLEILILFDENFNDLIQSTEKEYMKKQIFIPLMFFFCLFISSCLVLDESDDAPIYVDLAHTNQEITLEAIKEVNTFKTNDSIILFIFYNAEEKDARIEFPNDFNFRMFVKQDKNWLEIREYPTIRLYDTVVLMPTNNRSSVIIDPVLPDIKQKYNVRVYIFGDMFTEDGIQRVTAFTDFVLTP